MSSVVVSHDFSLELKEEVFSQDKIAIITIGTSGTGKSSIIKLFCGSNVVVGHSTNSETKESVLYRDRTSNRCWLDSQGANDSEGISDKKVLTDILKKLYNQKIKYIKIIWCVSGDMDRAKHEFKKQAKFIASLNTEIQNSMNGETLSSWDSCLIIKKRGDPDPNRIDLRGVLASAKEYGSDINQGDKNLFGFTGIQLCNQEMLNKDRLYSKIMKMTNNEERNKELMESGYITNNQIINQINLKLSNLPLLELKFVIKQCSKCGIIGDQRFIFAKCHLESEHIHTGHLKHSGALQWYHFAGLIPKPIHRTVYYHPGGCKVPDKTTKIVASIFIPTFAIGNAVTGGWNKKWNCCGRHPSSQGCHSKQEVIRTDYYYGCCNKIQGSSAGCRQKYSCCNGDVNNTGCIYSCCNQNKSAIGCYKRCKVNECHGKWGNSPGCVSTTNESY